MKVKLRFEKSFTFGTRKDKFLIGTKIPLIRGYLGYDDFGGRMIRPTSNTQHTDINAITHARPEPYKFPDAEPGTDATPLLSVATYNLEKFGEKFRGEEDASKNFNQKAQEIAGHIAQLNYPDIIALQEVGDDSGDKFDNVTGADKVLKKLTKALQGKGSPPEGVEYDPLYLEGAPNSVGGKPGLNIRNAFLVRKDFLGKGSTGGALAEQDLELIDRDVEDSLFVDKEGSFHLSRKPLILRYEVDGKPFVVVNVHLSSRLGSSTPNGECADNSPLARRAQQLRSIANYIGKLTAEEKQNLIVLGDFNTYWYCDELQPFKEQGLVNMLETKERHSDDRGDNEKEMIPENERYTTMYEGVGSAIDHIFISQSLVDRYPPGDKSYLSIHHLNTHLNENSNYDVNFPQSDHDPVTLTIVK